MDAFAVFQPLGIWLVLVAGIEKMENRRIEQRVIHVAMYPCLCSSFHEDFMAIRNDAHKGWYAWKNALLSFSLSLSSARQSPKNKMRHTLRAKDLVIYDIDHLDARDRNHAYVINGHYSPAKFTTTELLSWSIEWTWFNLHHVLKILLTLRKYERLIFHDSQVARFIRLFIRELVIAESYLYKKFQNLWLHAKKFFDFVWLMAHNIQWTITIFWMALICCE